MSRNRCGLCCHHRLGTLEALSTGTMVLRPSLADAAALFAALDAQEWRSEQAKGGNRLAVSTACSRC